MRRVFDFDLNASVIRDENKVIRSITFPDNGPDIADASGPAVPKSFLRGMADTLGLKLEDLGSLDQRESLDAAEKRGLAFHLSDEKTFFDTTTYVYRQTFLNTAIWNAGLTVTVKDGEGRVLSATNTSETGVDAKLPPVKDLSRYRRLFATAEKADTPKKSGSEKGGPQAQLSDILSAAMRGYGKTKPPAPGLINGRFFIYRYDAAKRLTDHPDLDPDAQDNAHEEEPSLPLPKVPQSIKNGDWRFVAELIVRFPYEGHRMNWRLLVDVQTDTVLYLRALSAGVNGLVFTYDPITSTGDNGNDATQSNAVLNPLRDDVILEGLDPPAGGTQSLTGEFVSVTNFHGPNIATPTQPAGTDFDFDARTDEFSAVNAYYHNDRFFRLVQDLGFPINDYFDGTSFPVPIDHRGLGGANNAHCGGDGDGIEHACYGLIDTSGGGAMGNSCEWSVVLHELGGHGILNDHVNDGVLGFSHSQGDSFAIILNDFASAWHNGGAIDRFIRSPFRQNTRRSDRAVADGWGWGGVNDDGVYKTEQILSTTMFRAYRSIGGDSVDLTRREFSANVMSYLLLRAVGTLSPVSNPNGPGPYLDALLTADAGDWTTHGVFGGAYSKVLVWAFEKQDLNDGAPPAVDVYIDDGRAGEYEYLADFTNTAAIWNRRTPDGIEAHQEPALGTNYAYVKIKNRGTSQANNTVVRGFHSMPFAGRVWPDDLQPMTTNELAAGVVQPNNAEEIIVGPFAWVPNEDAEGHDAMMMIVSAEGDPSNADKFDPTEEIEDWRLIPNDNNIGLRKVKLEPRLVTAIADSGDFGNVCRDTHKDMKLVLSNSGFGMLSVSNITSSSGDFELPSVLDYPIAIASGDSIALPIRFNPSGFGPSFATLTVFSDDPEGTKQVRVSGTSKPPRLVTIMADHGDFGSVCRKTFRDLVLTLNNSGPCKLRISSIASSSADFVVADVVTYPIVVGAGDSVQVPIRFAPNTLGAKSGIITVQSDDPTGDKTVAVSGKVPAGKLKVTGSTCIGGVKACCVGERRITVCNAGKCTLKVSKVGLSRKSKYWKLVNNPFPAKLRPGACLDLLIRYKAGEKCPKCMELVIKTDDPKTPKRRLDLMAYTVWQKPGRCKPDCGCEGGCECGCGDEGCTPQSLDACCFDEDCDKG